MAVTVNSANAAKIGQGRDIHRPTKRVAAGPYIQQRQRCCLRRRGVGRIHKVVTPLEASVLHLGAGSRRLWRLGKPRFPGFCKRPEGCPAHILAQDVIKSAAPVVVQDLVPAPACMSLQKVPNLPRNPVLSLAVVPLLRCESVHGGAVLLETSPVGHVLLPYRLPGILPKVLPNKDNNAKANL
jgi:hypothetical protein